MKTKVLKGINFVLATVLGFLGFGCNKPNKYMGGDFYPELMYGVSFPGSATYDVSGKVTDETNDKPVKNIRVTVKSKRGDFQGIYTKTNGSYSMLGAGVPCDSLNIVAEDTTGVYEPDSVQVEVVLVPGKNNDSRYAGKATVRQDFHLKKK